MIAFAFVVLIALASSACTLVGAYAWYQWRGRAQLEEVIADVQGEFEQRVKAGVSAAAVELLPKLREQVASGFEDAMKRSAAAGLVENAAGAVNVGTEIVAGGLQALLGIKAANKK